MYQKIVALIVFGIFYSWSSKADYAIQGTIQIEKEWEPKIYLSAINSFHDLNGVSEDFILQVAAIKPNGAFELMGQNIPNEDRLYRLHICKKGDPMATIMIGGKEENHCHLVMKNGDSIQFIGQKPLFQNAFISGNIGNEGLKEIQQQRYFWKKQQPINSKTNRAYNQAQLEDYLRNFADTTNFPLMGLLALHYLDYEKDLDQYSDFYQELNDQWSSQGISSPYLTHFQQSLAVVQMKKGELFNGWLLAGVLTMAVIIFWFFPLSAKKEIPLPTQEEKKATLSIQERRVFHLMYNGKSNKEISAELNIGISTVKSHVHSIYGKLGIRSRKEIAKFLF